MPPHLVFRSNVIWLRLTCFYHNLSYQSLAMETVTTRRKGEQVEKEEDTYAAYKVIVVIFYF